MNLLKSSISASYESWIPICLPNLNDGGFVYLYVKQNDSLTVCFVASKMESDIFYNLSFIGNMLGNVPDLFNEKEAIQISKVSF